MAQHLTEEDYTEIKRMKAAGYSLTVIGNRFGRKYATISNICNGKTYPKEAKTDRLNRRLIDDEYENIRRLAAKGLRQKDIADKIDRSCSVVCMALKHLAEMEGAPVEKRTYKDVPQIVDVDLSKLPDTVLFKHSREFCF